MVTMLLISKVQGVTQVNDIAGYDLGRSIADTPMI